MTSFELITDQDLSAFAATVRRNGWQTSDFELQEEAFDQATAEVEARKGQVGVRCLLTQAVTIYPLGDGSDWVATFAADLENGKFGQPAAGTMT
jgi:hypothetical protein